MYEQLKKQVLPQLIPPGSRILVAVSGGPDSMALAHILWRYMKEKKDQEISLVLTHVHHGVREESDDEEKMVKDMARDWKIPCLIHRFDSKAYAKSVGKSFQTAAREWRYAHWKADMEEESCTLLATAHHLGDQAETVLYRLLRGSGTAGLAGIYPQKGELIRPLLTVTKEDILGYCQKENLPFALDSSNEEPIYARNKIRLQLLPELKREFNPKVMEALGRMAELLRWDEEYFEGEVEKAWQSFALLSTAQKTGLELVVFELPKAILSRLIRKAATQVSGELRGIGYHYVDQIMASQGQVGWSQDLPGLRIEIDYQGVWFQRVDWKQDKISWQLNEVDLAAVEAAGIPTLFLPQKVNWSEWITWQDFEGKIWSAGLFDYEKDLDVKKYLDLCVDKVFFDLQALRTNFESLQWRNRKEGDNLWFERLGRKTLKKVFQDAKVSATFRKEIPLLALGNEILWIPGVKSGDRYRIQHKGGAIGILINGELNSINWP